jgi:hypothetical protein
MQLNHISAAVPVEIEDKQSADLSFHGIELVQRPKARLARVGDQHIDIPGVSVHDGSIGTVVAIEVRRHYFTGAFANGHFGRHHESAIAIVIGDDAIEIAQDHGQVVPAIAIQVRDAQCPRPGWDIHSLAGLLGEQRRASVGAMHLDGSQITRRGDQVQ